jgi:hypothetical protein
MKITFETPKEIVTVKETKGIFNEITIDQIIDNPSRKEVKAFTRELGILTLWENEGYDTIGQWTDANVIVRIQELLNK